MLRHHSYQALAQMAAPALVNLTTAIELWVGIYILYICRYIYIYLGMQVANSTTQRAKSRMGGFIGDFGRIQR